MESDSLAMLLLYGIVLFFIICGAVTMAIKPLIKVDDEEITDDSLTFMKEINLISGEELEEITQVYERIGIKKAQYKRYEKYAKVLGELKDAGYFGEEEYKSKMKSLKEYFNVE